MSWITTCWRSNRRNCLINDFPAEHCLHLPYSMTIQETAPHQQLLTGGMPALTLSPRWYDDLASLLPLASYVHWPSICAVNTILGVLCLLPLCSIFLLKSMLFAKVAYIIIYVQKWSCEVCIIIFLLYCQNQSVYYCYMENTPQSMQPLTQTHMCKSAQDTSPSNFYGIPIHPWPSWVSWGKVCYFRNEILPLFDHHFDRQSLTILLTRRCTREKCHVTLKFGSFLDLNLGKTPEN